jgi:hypothetical protein
MISNFYTFTDQKIKFKPFIEKLLRDYYNLLESLYLELLEKVELKAMILEYLGCYIGVGFIRSEEILDFYENSYGRNERISYLTINTYTAIILRNKLELLQDCIFLNCPHK